MAKKKLKKAKKLAQAKTLAGVKGETQ